MLRPKEIFGVPCRLVAAGLNHYKYPGNIKTPEKDEWDMWVEFASEPGVFYDVRYDSAYLATQIERLLKAGTIAPQNDSGDYADVVGVVGAFDKDLGTQTKFGDNPIRFLLPRSQREAPNTQPDEVWLGQEYYETQQAERRAAKKATAAK